SSTVGARARASTSRLPCSKRRARPRRIRRRSRRAFTLRPFADQREASMTELSDSIRKALEDANFWHVATVNPDGSPHSTAVWVELRGDRILVNTAKGRKKHRNLEHDPRVAMSWHTHEGGGYHSAAIQGRAVESYE